MLRQLICDWQRRGNRWTAWSQEEKMVFCRFRSVVASPLGPTYSIVFSCLSSSQTYTGSFLDSAHQNFTAFAHDHLAFTWTTNTVAAQPSLKARYSIQQIIVRLRKAQVQERHVNSQQYNLCSDLRFRFLGNWSHKETVIARIIGMLTNGTFRQLKNIDPPHQGLISSHKAEMDQSGLDRRPLFKCMGSKCL